MKKLLLKALYTTKALEIRSHKNMQTLEVEYYLYFFGKLISKDIFTDAEIMSAQDPYIARKRKAINLFYQ